MSELYEWIKNITYYLIFMTVVTTILPDKKYEKYIKLFAGMVLILLVLKPLTEGLRIEDKIAYYFNSISFQKEASELQDEISRMDKTRLDRMITEYEAAVAHDVGLMAEGAGFVNKGITAALESDKDSERFGRVTNISMVLCRPEEENIDEKEEIINEIKKIDNIEPITEITIQQDIPSVSREVRLSEDTAVNKLRRQISEYYDLEEEYIEVQLEDG